MVDLKDPQLKRLLSLSEQICIEEDALTDMTVNNLENTEKFDEHIDKLLSLFDKEEKIINSLSLNQINKFRRILDTNDKHNDKYVAYNRLSQLITDILDERTYNNPKLALELYQSKDESEEEITEELDSDTESDSEYNDDIEITDEMEDEIALLDDFYKNTDNLEKYLPSVIDRTTIIVAKKMYQRIRDTISSNKIEAKYKKKLLRFFKEFKYYFFTLDYKLERIGATHKYNLESIPIPEVINEDLTPLYHNQCIDSLDSLYSTDLSIQKNNDILTALYQLMCIEEYIKYLDKDSLNTLLEFCDKAENMLAFETFGKYGKARIRQRLEKYF